MNFYRRPMRRTIDRSLGMFEKDSLNSCMPGFRLGGRVECGQRQQVWLRDDQEKAGGDQQRDWSQRREQEGDTRLAPLATPGGDLLYSAAGRILNIKLALRAAENHEIAPGKKRTRPAESPADLPRLPLAPNRRSP